MEGPADGFKKIFRILQLPDGSDFLTRQCPRKHAVVRTNEDIICGLYGNGPTLAAHARIHHGHVHRASGEIAASGHQRECAGANVAWWNLVRDVHNERALIDTEYGTLHRADKPVACPEVSGQRGCVHGEKATLNCARLES